MVEPTCDLRKIRDDELVEYKIDCMTYLSKSIEIAECRGYFAYPEITRRARRIPKWFLRLGTRQGLDSLAQRIGHPIPAALVEYYSALLLASFLEYAANGFVLFEHEMKCGTIAADLFPIHLQWDASDYVAILDDSHNGMYLGASLKDADPEMFYGEPLGPDFPADWAVDVDVPNAVTIDCTFSEWVFALVDGYEKTLDNWEAVIRKVDKDPEERSRLGDLGYFRTLPGMERRLKRKS